MIAALGRLPRALIAAYVLQLVAYATRLVWSTAFATDRLHGTAWQLASSTSAAFTLAATLLAMLGVLELVRRCEHVTARSGAWLVVVGLGAAIAMRLLTLATLDTADHETRDAVDLFIRWGQIAIVIVVMTGWAVMARSALAGIGAAVVALVVVLEHSAIDVLLGDHHDYVAATRVGAMLSIGVTIAGVAIAALAVARSAPNARDDRGSPRSGLAQLATGAWIIVGAVSACGAAIALAAVRRGDDATVFYLVILAVAIGLVGAGFMGVGATGACRPTDRGAGPWWLHACAALAFGAAACALEVLPSLFLAAMHRVGSTDGGYGVLTCAACGVGGVLAALIAAGAMMRARDDHGGAATITRGLIAFCALMGIAAVAMAGALVGGTAPSAATLAIAGLSTFGGLVVAALSLGAACRRAGAPPPAIPVARVVR